MSASSPAPVVLWFRLDLRLTDNPALAAALATGRPVLPLFVLDDEDAGPWAPGGASRWWLHHSLAALAADLDRRGSRLILRRGPARRVLDALIAETGADTVHWNRRYEPWATVRDRAIKADLKDRGLTVESHNAALLFEPWTIQTRTGGPYRVYTPFWRACRASADFPAPTVAPRQIPAPSPWPVSDDLADWRLTPTKPDWAGGLRDTWTPGEAGAVGRLDRFLDDAVTKYDTDRNHPDRPGTSGLSPHLHWGEIGPRQIWRAVEHRRQTGDVQGADDQVETFLKEIVWREFSYHLLFHFPGLPEAPLDRRFDVFPWAADSGDTHLTAWQRGRTGYPIVDAGMRELYATGWMHNRVRMITASFLVKHLLLEWQKGEAWFWDCLVDADLASNSASWQWVGGCGADAAPYFRIFNPVLQGEKFDPAGAYVRRWVPELAGLPDKWIHKPWDAPQRILDDAGIALGRDYPVPIVDHKAARQRALDAFATLKGRQAA